MEGRIPCQGLSSENVQTMIILMLSCRVGRADLRILGLLELGAPLVHSPYLQTAGASQMQMVRTSPTSLRSTAQVNSQSWLVRKQYPNAVRTGATNKWQNRMRLQKKCCKWGGEVRPDLCRPTFNLLGKGYLVEVDRQSTIAQIRAASQMARMWQEMCHASEKKYVFMLCGAQVAVVRWDLDQSLRILKNINIRMKHD